jgi:hypothetical protein
MRIAQEQHVRESGQGKAVTGFPGVRQMYVAFAAKPSWRGSLTLVLEHSDDGVEWSEAASFTFTRGGTRGHLDQVAEPKDQLRLRWTITGGTWNFSVDVGSPE